MEGKFSPVEQYVLSALARVANKQEGESLDAVLNEVVLILTKAIDAKE